MLGADIDMIVFSGGCCRFFDYLFEELSSLSAIMIKSASQPFCFFFVLSPFLFLRFCVFCVFVVMLCHAPPIPFSDSKLYAKLPFSESMAASK